MVKVIWTDIAIEDLKSIHEYISKDSKFYADRVLTKLLTRVDQLSRSPEFGNTDIRELIEGNYRIIFRVKTDYVGIARVHHSAKQLRDI